MVMEKDTNKPVREDQELPNQKAEELMAEGKRKKNNGKRKVNNLWLWLGVIILIFILVWWLWTVGMVEDTTGITNG